MRNPDLVAPGVHIESLRDPGSNIDLQYGSTATVGGRFFLGSGTSQAAAVVSGAAALLLSQHPDWSPDDVKYALASTATPLSNQPATAQGSGELNVPRTSGFRHRHRRHLRAVQATTPPRRHRPFHSSGQHQQTFTPPRPAPVRSTPRAAASMSPPAVSRSPVRQDIMGNAFNSATMAAAEASQSAWNSGTWNGAGWAGAGWAGAGLGRRRAGPARAGPARAGPVRAGPAAPGTGAGWAGAGWAGAGWAGAGWAGAGWAGAGWAGRWAGAGWADASWD